MTERSENHGSVFLISYRSILLKLFGVRLEFGEGENDREGEEAVNVGEC